MPQAQPKPGVVLTPDTAHTAYPISVTPPAGAVPGVFCLSLATEQRFLVLEAVYRPGGLGCSVVAGAHLSLGL